MERYQEVVVALSEYVMKISAEALPGDEITMTSYPVGNKTSLSRKPYIADKTYYISLLGSYGRSFRIRHAQGKHTFAVLCERLTSLATFIN